MSTFFVTGGSGFVGSHLTRRLLREGHHVRGLSRQPPRGRSESPAIDWIEGNVTDPASYRSALRDADYVIHLAGLISARRHSDYFRANVAGTEALLRACLDAGSRVRRVVHVSSIAAMGPNYDGTLLTESDFCRPLSVYGTSKRDAETVATRYASRIPVIILRPAFIYGIGDARAPAHLRAILGPLVRPWKSNIRELSFCHVEDVAGSLLAAARSETGSGEVFIISEEEVHTWDGLREILIQLFRRLVGDRDEAVSEAARSLLMRARQIDVLPVSLPRYQYWGCNTKKARSVLGFETVRCVRSDAADVIRSYLVQGFLGPACVSATRKA